MPSSFPVLPQERWSTRGSGLKRQNVTSNAPGGRGTGARATGTLTVRLRSRSFPGLTSEDRLSRWPRDVVERVTGIEPALSAWEAEVLPVNYTREQR